MHSAIENVGRSTLIIKGDKVIGKTVVSGMRGNQVAMITLSEADYNKFVKPLLQSDADEWRRPCGVAEHKLVSFRFLPWSGGFIECNIGANPSGGAVDEWFDDVRIVDEFNLGYGMVPDLFKDVEGYKNQLTMRGN